MRTTLFCLLLCLLVHVGFAQEQEQYAVLVVHRAAKSTNMGEKYDLVVNGRKAGKLEGVSTAFKAEPEEDWLVTKIKREGKAKVAVTKSKWLSNAETIMEQIPSNESKDEEINDLLEFQVKKGQMYFVEFDASVAYGINSMSLLEKKKGYSMVLKGNLKNKHFTHNELKDDIEGITYNVLEELKDQQSSGEKIVAEDNAKEKDKTIPVVEEQKNSQQQKQAPVQEKQAPVQEKPFSSDVDKHIPVVAGQDPYRFALIIGNEDYQSYQKSLKSEVNVDYAIRDARVFKEYASKTLKVPEANIVMELNADAVTMSRAVKKINLLIKNTSGKAEVFVYYAGHGLPDEVTNEPYLIPVNVSGSDLDYAVKLEELYHQLTEYPAKRVTVFIDACFSGGARNQGLVSARGIKVKPKTNRLNGKLVVLSASSGKQSSLPYEDKKHGIFTYFLLKKLQATKGNVSYKELAGYLKEQVSVKSILVNEKEQNPQVNISSDLQDEWKNWHINE